MKQYRTLFIFIALMLAVSLACNGGAAPADDPTPTKASVVPNPPSNNGNPPSNNNGDSSSNSGNSDVITVEDQNQLYTFDIPGNWTYESNDLGNAVYSDVYMYADTWTSPDGSGLIEGISGRSEGFDFNGTTSTRVALDMLNYYYSSTGNEGDIRISKTSTAEDGSTRFDWISKAGDYSGISWFEVRGTRTFLMWTLSWANDADQSVLDELTNAMNTYQVQTK